MNFPKFWAQGSHGDFSCWRWSDVSFDDALASAKNAAEKFAEKFSSGGAEGLSRYGYGERPLREPVMREVAGASGQPAAVITRNAYGCLVLNTERVAFIDVDLPAPKKPAGLFARLFSKTKTPAPNGGHTAVIEKAETWARQNPGWGWRIYRTRAGLRLLATHALFEPGSEPMEAVFDALGADPLYRRLCRDQKCFRARLTPKPWRCGLGNPPARWPWRDARAESRFNEWEKRYLVECGNWATCELISTVGSDVHPEVEPVVAFHDAATRVESQLMLA